MKAFEPMSRNALIAYLKELLPQPIRIDEGDDESLMLVGGDPDEVIVQIAATEVTVSVFSVRWERPYTPLVCPQPLDTLVWRQLPEQDLKTLLRTLVSTASQQRRENYSVCKICGEVNPPEWMLEDAVCHSCAERELGVVF